MSDWHKMSLADLSAELGAGRISSRELTEGMIGRIESLDVDVGAYLTTTFDVAMERAAKIDDRRSKGDELTPLAGIPYALKDNICSRGTRTTCASRMLENFTPPYSAVIAERLDAAGGALLGKLNMDEFAMGSSTENSYFQKTKNPHDLSRVPGGSSGGSAAAVAAGTAVYAIGSDTGGSIRQPASLCGVVGMKPTYGRIPRAGVVAFASSLDQAGTLTRDVRDAAMVLNAVSGQDYRDASSLQGPVPDFTKGIADGVKGLRVGVPVEYFGEGSQKEVVDAVRHAAAQLEKLGAVVEETSLPFTPYALASYYMISSAEACSNLGRYDGVRYGHRAADYDGLMDMICRSRNEGFGEEVKRRILLGTYALSAGYYDAYYKRAQQVRTRIIEDFNNAFSRFDVLLTPTSPVTAWEFGAKSEPMEMYAADVCTVAVNVAGLPAISLPVGVDKAKLPIGAQIIAPALEEVKMFQVAYALEQLFPPLLSPLMDR